MDHPAREFVHQDDDLKQGSRDTKRGRKGKLCVWQVDGDGIWEKVRVQIDSGAIRTVGPTDVTEVFQMKETVISKKGMGHVAATWNNIKNYGEKTVVG